jgi:hypothetical protein
MMKKIFLVLLVSLMAISLVLAAQGDVGTGQQGTAEEGTQTNNELQTQNQGAETQLQNQVQVQTGTYMNQAGAQMQIQTGEGNEVKLQSGNVEAKTTMSMTQEQAQNKTTLKTQLSNGKNVEIKIMPNVASETALVRLRLKTCNSENNCTIELKEVGQGEQVKAAYEVQVQRHMKVLAMFQTKAQVKAQVDAETGEVISIKKPWWAFLATQPEE